MKHRKREKEIKDMAKSKLIAANKKIEKGIVGGYSKIEKGAVGGFHKIADKFVDNYLTRDGETIEEARARLLAEQKEREERSKKEMEERKYKVK